MDKPLLIAFATREGQTSRIADRLKAMFEARGATVDVVNVAHDGNVDVEYYAACILAASVHVGKHEPEMAAFVKAHRTSLERVPTAFLSVSLSEAGAEQRIAAPLRSARAGADVARLVDAFLRETAWRPTWVLPVAGAIAYEQYAPLVRVVMRLIARRSGGDAWHDREYTDWAALDRFAGDVWKDIKQARDAAAWSSRPQR